MKKIFLIATLMASSVSAFAINKADLVGTWQCPYTDSKLGVSIMSIDTYNADGTASSTSKTTLKLPNAKKPINLSSTMQATWQLSGTKLSLSLSDVKTSSADAPDVAKMFEQQSAQVKTSHSNIESLTKNELIVRELSQNIRITCTR